MEKNYIFDYHFYIHFYPDIKFALENHNLNPIDHYIKYGRFEKRIRCEKELNDIIQENLIKITIQYQILLNTTFKKPENKLNILIRTSKRPSFFKKCIESILTQKYNNYHIYICYDNMDSLNYITDYETTNTNITSFFVKNNSIEKYKFNLYNNDLMDKVTDGFILFLDDDDIYTHDQCFKVINENIIDDNSILLWEFMRPDKLVYPKTINNIKLGEIDTTSICFNNKYKYFSRWKDKQCGDYYFYINLFNNLKKSHDFELIKMNYILTKTIYFNKMCGSL